MLHQSTVFNDAGELLPLLDEDDSFFRFATLDEMSLNGGHICATFLNCEFRKLNWYWGIFNLVLFVECRFQNCTFLGTAFMGCKFVECTFSDCRFDRDNLNANCSFEETKWYGCEQAGTVGLPNFR